MKVKYDDPVKAIHAWKKIKKKGEQVKVILDFSNNYSSVYIYMESEMIELKLEHVLVYNRPMRISMLLESNSSILQQLLRDCYLDYYSKNIDKIGIQGSDAIYYMDTVIIYDKKGIKYRHDVICFDHSRCIEFWKDDIGWCITASRGFRMFNNNSFMTRGFNAEIPDNIKEFISHIIVKCSQLHDTDYLQIFRLYTDKSDSSVQLIEHTQENPNKKMIYGIMGDFDKVTAKVYVIDDTSHHTYLLASEY